MAAASRKKRRKKRRRRRKRMSKTIKSVLSISSLLNAVRRPVRLMKSSIANSKILPLAPTVHVWFHLSM